MTLEQLHAIVLEQAQHMDNLYLRNVPAVVLQEFATRSLAAIIEKAEPVHQWRLRNSDVWYDASKDEAYSRVDEYYEARTLFVPAAIEPALQQEDHTHTHTHTHTPRYCSEQRLKVVPK